MIKINQVQVFKPTMPNNAVEVRLRAGDDLSLYIAMNSQEAFTLASRILKQLAQHTDHSIKADVDGMLLRLNSELGLSTLELL